jgi:tetratricopeptide (TPR) repeat protein
MTETPQERADELFELAKAKREAGDEHGALTLYLESLALNRDQPIALYNVGLIYKYRRDWKESLRYNRLAAELRPDDQATNWNLGIAATALREWRLAREAWRRAGIKVEEGDGPIVARFGFTPVRLNGFEEKDGQAEVVWAHRLSPVTARIANIPTPEAGFRFGDVVLHDGAPTGTRLYAPGDERSVFNVFELFEASDYVTFDVDLVAPDDAAIEALSAACEAAGIEIEDWTESIQYLCKACSEGRAHDQHDHSLKNDEWQARRRIGMASPDAAKVHAVLETWSEEGGGRSVAGVGSED